MGRFLDNLTILFIGLKLAGFIAWSWFFVLLPISLSAFAGFWMAFKPHYEKAKKQREWRKLKEQVKAEKADTDGDQ